MRNTVIILIVLFITGCKSDHGREDSKTEYQSLLKKFREIKMDTFKVRSPEQNNLKDNFFGVALDSTEAILFPKEFSSSHIYDYPSLFACYKFSIDSDRIGLIMRTSGEYVASSIKLFIYDKKESLIKEHIELADSWGDAGDFMAKDSWIIKEHSKYLSLIRMEVGHDNSVDNELDTTTEHNEYYYLIDLTLQFDTLSKDSSELVNRYKKLTRK